MFFDLFVLVVKSRFKANQSLKHYLEAGKFPKNFFKHGSIKDQPRDTQSIDLKIAHCIIPINLTIIYNFQSKKKETHVVGLFPMQNQRQ